MKFYSPIEFSPHIRKTPEGFLACEGVAIARAGELIYGADEVPLDADANGIVKVTRSADVLLDKECLASFESKPITLDHPPDFVTPETFKEYAVGAVQNVRGDGDRIIADLLIMDESAIRAVENKEFRELSCGYDADYEQVSVGRGRQTRILGNHVALVGRGRCGATCAIFDKAPAKDLTMKDKILALFGKALDEAMPESEPEKTADFTPEKLAETLQSILARLDALENPQSADAPAEPDAEKVADESDAVQAENAESEPEKVADEPTAIEARLGVIEENLQKILAALDVPPATDESAEKVENTFDAATLAAGEILAPELKPCADYEQKALGVAYDTKDGRAVIDSLLRGRSFDSAKDDGTLFVAAAELLKAKRRSAFDVQPKDVKPFGVMTPERLNELNFQFFKGK